MRIARWMVLAVLVCTPPAWAATPEETARALQAVVEGARASDSDRLLIVRDGQRLADYRKPGTPAAGAPGDAIETMSVTKSLVALGVGRLLTLGRIASLDQPVSDFYPEWKQGRKAEITVRMLLNHTSGLQNVANTSVEIYPAPDGLKLALAAELSDAPGAAFSYNNKAMNLLAGVIEQACGLRMDHCLEQQLLAPMGIAGPAWNSDGFDRAGHPYAMAGWSASAETAAKIGQLVLDHGRWNGQPLIDAGYVEQMTAQSQPYNRGYGLLWWRRPARDVLTVDPGALARYRDAGVDAALLQRLQPLAGRAFDDGASLRTALREALGEDLAALGKSATAHGLTLDGLVGKDDSSPIVAWEANGYLGQYIVVVPKARLVAVRQVRARDDYDGQAPWPHGYDDFTRRVIALAQTLVPDLDAAR